MLTYSIEVIWVFFHHCKHSEQKQDLVINAGGLQFLSLLSANETLLLMCET